MLAPEPITRRALLSSGSLRVETLRCRRLTRDGTPEVYSPERQLLLAISGAFRWHIGREVHFVDANHIAFVRDGETSHDSHPTGSDVTCVLVTPSPELAALLWSAVDPFARRTAMASNPLQLAAAGFLAALDRPDLEPMVAEEWAIHLLGAATRCAAVARPDRPDGARRLAARARELLSTTGAPLSLPVLAGMLSVSPSYLTDAFRRAEGLPIVRYQLKLRLMRALAELPHTDDLTRLALDLGFSSHSHFSTAFRAAMGMTPSRYRRHARAGDRRDLVGERS